MTISLSRDWGDSLPLYPATRQAVDALLEGTCLPPDHLVCDMPPGFGLATVEKIAINAAMAGALPEHVAGGHRGGQGVVRKLGPHGGKSLLMSTSPHAPVLMVNGPIAREIGLNPRSGLGPGRDNQVNITIGRAFSLCPAQHRAVVSPATWTWIPSARPASSYIAWPRNEAMSPWEPFHVDRGFSREESAISIFVTDGELDVTGPRATPAREGLLKTIAYGCTFGTRSLGERHDAERLIFMPPDVARPVGAQGFSKRGAKEFIHLNAQRQPGQDDPVHAPGRRGAGPPPTGSGC